MAWAHIILYVTAGDAARIRDWINRETDVAWIVGDSRVGRTYFWRAVDRLDAIQPQEFCLWHKIGQRLTVPSASGGSDAEVSDPYQGWSQTLEGDDATRPWFGGNLPGPYVFAFREKGKSAPDALARSGFSWAANHYRLIGKPAHPAAKQWWDHLKRFVQKNSTSLPWPHASMNSRIHAYAFTEAYAHIRDGRPVDDNP